MAPPLHADPTPAWHRHTTATEPGGERRSVVYGDDVPTEETLKLLGPVDGARILDLGCGTGANAVLLAQQGAKVIGVDPSVDRLAIARDRAEQADVRVELHQAHAADLAFLRSDSVDTALSVMALAEVDDLARVFRQVHRVLKPGAPFVISFPHPAFAMFDPAAPDPLRAVRPYDQSEPITWTRADGTAVTDHPRTISAIFTTLQRSSFGVDQLLEPTADPAVGGQPSADLARHVPPTLVFRARKQGN
ncbi:MAG: class I SAM-dependent methyltransferase [Actinobacteria bacterium]|nr:class I SAM-dependent methyltransferase [Actinomycetota bacterium]